MSCWCPSPLGPVNPTGVMEPVCPHGVLSHGGGCAQQNQSLTGVTDTVRGVK